MKFDRVSSLLFLSVLSGVLLGLGHLPGTSALGFFGTVPLYWSWCCGPSKSRGRGPSAFWDFLRGFASGWIAQTLLFLIAAHWVLHGIREFGMKDPVLSLGAFLAMAAFNSFAFPFAGGIVCLFAPRMERRLSRVLFAASLVTLGEILLPSLIPAPLGHMAVLTDIPLSDRMYLRSTMPLVQLVDWIGLAGVSFLVTLFAALVSLATRTAFLSALAFLLAFNLLGAVHGEKWFTRQRGDRKATVLLVQPLIPNEEKRRIGSPLVARAIVERQIALTQKVLKEKLASGSLAPELIVWPETAFPDALDEVYGGGVLAMELTGFVKGTGVPLMTGAFSRDPLLHREANAVFVVDPGGIPRRPYVKTRLFPFSETVPLANWFPSIRRLFPEISEYSDSRGASTLSVGPLRGGISICYEALFGEFASEAAKNGANVLFNLSNEAWFGTEQASRQFLAFARARAMESRLTLVRVSNFANTVVVEPNGFVVGGLAKAEQGALFREIEASDRPNRTLFVEFPSLTAALAVVLALVMLGLRTRAPRDPISSGLE